MGLGKVPGIFPVYVFEGLTAAPDGNAQIWALMAFSIWHREYLAAPG